MFSTYFLNCKMRACLHNLWSVMLCLLYWMIQPIMVVIPDPRRNKLRYCPITNPWNTKAKMSALQPSRHLTSLSWQYLLRKLYPWIKNLKQAQHFLERIISCHNDGGLSSSDRAMYKVLVYSQFCELKKQSLSRIRFKAMWSYSWTFLKS